MSIYREVSLPEDELQVCIVSVRHMDLFDILVALAGLAVAFDEGTAPVALSLAHQSLSSTLHFIQRTFTRRFVILRTVSGHGDIGEANRFHGVRHERDI